MNFKLTKDKSKKSIIINTLFECLYENGISGITMRQIANKANINLGSLHYYFKSKENLLVEFIRALFERFIYDVEVRYNSSDSPEKKLDAFFSGGKNFVLKQKELFVVLIDIWPLSIRNPQMQQIFSEVCKKLSKVMDDILEEGMKKGVFNKIKKFTLSISFVSFVMGIGLTWHMLDGSFNLKARFDDECRNLKTLIIKK